MRKIPRSGMSIVEVGILLQIIEQSVNYNWTDCSWRGRVYCDGDLVIVSSAANRPTFTKNAIIEGFVPVVVQDGL